MQFRALLRSSTIVVTLLLAGCSKEKSAIPNVPEPNPAEVAATRYISTHQEELGIRPSIDQFWAYLVDNDELEITHVRYHQYYKSVMVEAGELIIHLDSVLQVTGVSGVWMHNVEEDIEPYYSASDAASIAAWYYSSDGKAVAHQASVVLEILRWDEVDRLCWAATLHSIDGTERRQYFIDAHDGEVITWRYLVVT